MIFPSDPIRDPRSKSPLVDFRLLHCPLRFIFFSIRRDPPCITGKDQSGNECVQIPKLPSLTRTPLFQSCTFSLNVGSLFLCLCICCCLSFCLFVANCFTFESSLSIFLLAHVGQLGSSEELDTSLKSSKSEKINSNICQSSNPFRQQQR